jgi:16S rRNA (uracil1498-N3)-methyltransferase
VHRFFLPPGQCHGASLALSERDAHHALKVLRLRPGERVTVLDGAGRQLLCEAASTASRRVALSVIERHDIPPLPHQVTLIQAMPRGRAMELIVQKATELGAHRIVPLLAERSTPQVDGEGAAAKVEKWTLTAIEALKQCGSAWLPRIATPARLDDLLRDGESAELSLLASLHGDRRHPREHFAAFAARHRRKPRSVALWIGPEGDFTPGEIARIMDSGALPVTLGPLTLRSETAAICGLSVVNCELQAP